MIRRWVHEDTFALICGRGTVLNLNGVAAKKTWGIPSTRIGKVLRRPNMPILPISQLTIFPGGIKFWAEPDFNLGIIPKCYDQSG